MGKTNKSIADTEKQRDHPVNPEDLERGPRKPGTGPQISREKGEYFQTEEEREKNRIDRDR